MHNVKGVEAIRHVLCWVEHTTDVLSNVQVKGCVPKLH